MTDPLRVRFLTLTDTHASEHVYMAALKDALTDRGVVAVDDWRDADVVHLFEVNFYSQAALSEFAYTTLVRILRSNTPVVASTDDLYFIDRPELTARPRLYLLNHLTQRWLFRNCDAIIAISESVKQALTEYLSTSKLHVVRHGVGQRYMNDDPPANPPFVLHVSLASPRKNPEAVVETAKRLDQRFVIAGSGWGELIPDTQETTNVELRGYVPEDELVNLYHNAAVFYFPTLHEGFGLPVLEAMAARTAVVTSDVYSVPEVAGDAAVLCKPHDVEQHVGAIRRLMRNEMERSQLVEIARERSREFTWRRSAQKTEEVYRTVIAKRLD